MERPYIWFHTGAGFSVAAIGILLATLAALAEMLDPPESSTLQFALVFTTYAIGLLPAFLDERSQLARRRGRRSDAEQV